jgi:hypothetical protein
MRRLGLAALAAIAVLACDGGLQPVARCPSGVCGTITIRGAQPESTHVVLVIAYRTFPQTCAEILDFVPGSPPVIPAGVTTATYTLLVPDGRYEWIVAVWKKIGALSGTPADTALLREAGYTGIQRTPPKRAPCARRPGVGGVDFVVDLDDLHPITDYVTCTAR